MPWLDGITICYFLWHIFFSLLEGKYFRSPTACHIDWQENLIWLFIVGLRVFELSVAACYSIFPYRCLSVVRMLKGQTHTGTTMPTSKRDKIANNGTLEYDNAKQEIN